MSVEFSAKESLPSNDNEQEIKTSAKFLLFLRQLDSHEKPRGANDVMRSAHPHLRVFQWPHFRLNFVIFGNYLSLSFLLEI